MKVKDKLFGFEVESIPFDNNVRRPKPPKGYISFNSRNAHCQKGKCPNCGAEKPGVSGGGGRGHGFQDKMVMDISRATERIEKFYWNNEHLRPKYEGDNCVEETNFSSKHSYDLFCTDVGGVMLKCHWSRWSAGEFCCCGAKIWHDFCGKDVEGTNFKSDTWNHYYLPTQVEKQVEEGKIKVEDLVQVNDNRQEGLSAFGF